MSGSIALNVDDASSRRWEVAYPDLGLTSTAARPAIRLRGSLPPWLGPVATRISQLAALPTVDPRGSRPMNANDVLDALTFMSRVMRDDTVAPWIGRLASGGLQLTWHVGDVEVEAVFDQTRGDHEIMVTVGHSEWDLPIREGESLFASVVDRLSESHLEQASA